jgi:hypothetical protein
MHKNIKDMKFGFLLIMPLINISCFFLKADAPNTRKLRHVVAFKFKPEVSTGEMQKAATDFRNLKAQIPQIIGFEGGADLAFEKKKSKYTYCFIVTVNNEKDLAIYGAHPKHKAFSKSVDPLLAEVMVVDYWAE